MALDRLTVESQSLMIIGLLCRVLWKRDGSLKAVNGDLLARLDPLYRASNAYHRRNTVLAGDNGPV